MNNIPRLSDAVYVGLCHEVGTPSQVRMRREIDNTTEVVNKPVHIMRGNEVLKSGSKGEGFRLESSDNDIMLWPPNHKVICDLSQISFYRIPEHTLILMECDDLPPGFTMLYLMSSSRVASIACSCVVINNKFYISSTLFRSNHLRALKTMDVSTASSVPHGPCSTFVSMDGDVDYAYCFRSHHWPIKALPWIQRCRKHGWPSEILISKILTAGFHVVLIGSTPENGEEWRISISQAEQKLVYSMNHCQFLCYGLFKIFLREVINFQNNSPVLCSYFIKTIVFWVIQINTSLTWIPDNLLYCFWECFKLLIYWVRIGVCPNFFIPENNMFRMKVTGSVQSSLLGQLYALYRKGIPCLLLSQTLKPYLSNAISQRTLRVGTIENSIKSRTELDTSFFEELLTLFQYILRVEEFAACMIRIEKVIRKKLTQYQKATIQHLTSVILRNTAMLIQNEIRPKRNSNKIDYETNKVYILLKRSCALGFASDILYLAMYFYKTRSYEHSIRCLHIAQRRMSEPFIMYNANVNRDIYRQYSAGLSLDNIMKRAVVKNIKLYHKYTYIDELELEQVINEKNCSHMLIIPPLVLLQMLLILNHHRLGNKMRSKQVIRELMILLLHDKRLYVSAYLRDISWQILGICQQICGDFLGSLDSFQHSLQQYPYHMLEEATLLRMNALVH